MARVSFYVQLEPEFFNWDPKRLRKVSPRRITSRYPRDPLPGVLLTRLTIDIDDAAFMPLEPNVEIKIPVERTEAIKVESAPLEVPS